MITFHDHASYYTFPRSKLFVLGIRHFAGKKAVPPSGADCDQDKQLICPLLESDTIYPQSSGLLNPALLSYLGKTDENS